MPSLGQVYEGPDGEEWEVIAVRPRVPNDRYELLQVSKTVPPHDTTTTVTREKLYTNFSLLREA